MDQIALLAFATLLVETAKISAQNGGYLDRCLELAGRAATLVEASFELQLKAKPSALWVVWLSEFGEKKIQCIKCVRDFTTLGLKEAKELVEAHPCSLLTTADEALARRMYEELIVIRDVPSYGGCPSGVKVELRKTEVP